MQALHHHFMNNCCHHNLPLWVWLICVVGIGRPVSAQPEVYGNPDSSAFIRIPSDTDDWTRHFRIGAMVGMNISANFSMNGSAFGISGNDPSHGIYDDGYVRTDQTGNAGGYTGYWGYNNASQYNPANGGTIDMHAATSFSTSGSANESGSVFPGFDMAYGDNLWYWKHARVGWELGVGLLPIYISEKSSLPATVNQTTYTFNTGGIVIPTAPYQGGPSGQGEPIISTSYTSTNSQSYGNVTGTHTLEVMLYTFRLGPSFYWDLTEHLGMSLGAGPAVGIVNGDYKYDETIAAGTVSAHNKGQIGGTDLVYGGYVNATLMYHAVDNGDIFIGAQYMPMSDATISGQSREGRLNLGGQLYFSVGISWPF
jgi:hypothetical protein